MLLDVPVMALLLALSDPASRGAPQAAVDHVVVVVLDDVGVDKIGAYGEHPTAGPTPTIDAMAAEGVLFRAAYANPVCSPSRCSALTGLWANHSGIGTSVPFGEPEDSPNGDFTPADDLPWLPRLLSRSGVLCDAVGKWHLNHVLMPDYLRHPSSVGFRRHAGPPGGLGYGIDPAHHPGYWHWLKNVSTAQSDAVSETTTYATLDSMHEALASLSNADDAGRRSFLWLALNAAHVPWDAPPANYYDGPFETDPEQQQGVLAAADAMLGDLREVWSQLRPEAASRTLWIVMGDNGTTEDAVEAPWPEKHNKATIFEGGVRVPLIVTGPGVARGQECAAVVHAVDLWATVLDLLDVSPPASGMHSDALSFAPAFARPLSFAGRGWAYSRTHEPNGFGPFTSEDRAVRSASGWKLHVKTDAAGSTKLKLFHLPDDPHELSNLWPPSTPEEQAAADELQALLAGVEDAPRR